MDLPEQHRLHANAPSAIDLNSEEKGSKPYLIPEFIRIPDAQKIFAVKRGVLYRLIGANKIRSINLRESGSKTGVRLIDYQSLKSYLEKFAEGPESTE